VDGMDLAKRLEEKMQLIIDVAEEIAILKNDDDEEAQYLLDRVIKEYKEELSFVIDYFVTEQLEEDNDEEPTWLTLYRQAKSTVIKAEVNLEMLLKII
jgi:hypothetical protein